MLVILFAITWEVLQSNWVANKISKLTTSYVKTVLDSELQFENIEFEFFPPGAKLKNVSFTGVKSGVIANVSMGSVGIYFNPFDIFRTDFIVDSIRVNDSHIKMTWPKKMHEARTPITRSESPMDIFEHLQDVPIKKIIISEAYIEVDDHQGYIKNLQVLNENQFLDINANLANIDLNYLAGKNQYIDELSFSLTVDRQEIIFESLSLKTDLTQISCVGKIRNYISKNIHYDIKFNANGLLNSIHEWLNFEKIGTLHRGEVEVSGHVTGEHKKFSSTITANLKDFDTDFISGDSGKLVLEINESKILFKEVDLIRKDERLTLSKSFEFYNFITAKFVEEPIIANATNLQFSNFLRYLKESTSFMDGAITGQVRFDLFKNGFTFSIDDPVLLNYFDIKTSEKFKIISFSNFAIEKARFDFFDGIFQMNVFLSNEKTNLNVKGEVGKGKVDFSIPLAFLELDKFDLIANQKVLGNGTLMFDLKKQNNKIMINTKNDFKNLNILGISFDKVKADVDYDLGSNLIKIKKINASSGQSALKGEGSFNYENFDISGDYIFNKLTFSETRKILGEYLKNLNIENEEINGEFNIKGVIAGKANLSKMIVTGQLDSLNFYTYDEMIDSLHFNFFLEEEIFKIENLVAAKSRGSIFSDLSFDLKSSLFKFNLSVDGILLQDLSLINNFPTTVKGKLNGKIHGSYFEGNWKLKSELKVYESYALAGSLGDTILKFEIDDDGARTSLNGLGEKIRFDSNIFFDSKKLSSAKLKLKFDDIKNVLALISGVDLINMDIQGKIDYEASVEFDYKQRKVRNSYLNTKNLSFKKGPINVDYFNLDPEIIVTDGKIEKWKTDIRGQNFYLISRGEGDLFGDYSTDSQLKIDASIMEVFNNWISKANGIIRGKFILGSKEKSPIYEAFISSRNLSLASELIPTAINNTDMRIGFKDNKISLEKFRAQLSNGYLNIDGFIDIGKFIPDVNIKLKLEDAGFTVMKKSNLVISGNGNLIGKNFPYTLSGDFYIQKFALINELTDFGFSGSKFRKSDIDYLPNKNSIIRDQVLNLNINILTREPMYVRNSLADLGFVGNLQVLGGEKDLRLQGKVNLATRNNKITFKNNEYIFSKGNVIFSQDENFKNPELDFFASTNINGIGINTALLGPVNNFEFKLSSDKDLTQTDILSLIIFGYTEDLSNNLSDAEKESMTRAGVGSIIFDSFKINETLKDEFGVQVNLGTEISKSEGNYLSAKNSESTTGKVRSATTFEVKKKINDSTSLSVLGTVSSSSTQKRAVNLNYKINPSLSVEGVYESISTDDSETINSENSLGADVKWKWSFK